MYICTYIYIFYTFMHRRHQLQTQQSTHAEFANPGGGAVSFKATTGLAEARQVGKMTVGLTEDRHCETTRWILYCRKHCAPVSDHICWEFSSGDWVWQRCSNHAGALWYQVRIPVVHLAPWTLDVDNESSWIWSGWRSLCLFVVEVQIKTSKLACSVLRLEGDHGVIYPSVSFGKQTWQHFPWFSMIFPFQKTSISGGLPLALFDFPPEWARPRLELCRILGAALCGHQDFALELDQAGGGKVPVASSTCTTVVLMLKKTMEMMSTSEDF